MADIWICSDCRSANDAKQKRCYKCRVLRSQGEMTDASAAMATSAKRETRTVLATAARMGARYRPTWPIAIFVVPLILIVTSLEIERTRIMSSMVGADGRWIGDQATFDQWVSLLAWSLGIGAVSFLAWSFWIAFVVWNVPALTARWPPNSPIGAFFAPYIPIIGFKRPYSVVRAVLTLLTDGRAAPQAIALAWWVLMLASYFGPTIAILLGPRFPTELAAVAFAGWVRLAFLVPAGILAVTLVVVIERAQRLALGRRAAVVAPESLRPSA